MEKTAQDHAVKVPNCKVKSPLMPFPLAATLLSFTLVFSTVDGGAVKLAACILLFRVCCCNKKDYSHYTESLKLMFYSFLRDEYE